MFWTGLVVALVAMVVFKLGALSVWTQVTSMVLTLLFFAALGWGVLAVWRRLTRRTRTAVRGQAFPGKPD